MRILVVNDQFENGGAGRVTATMCSELVKRGYDIDVITDNINFKIRYELPIDINIHSIEFVSKRKGMLSRLKSLIYTSYKIRSVVKSINPDIIVAIQSNGFIRTFLANWRTQIPIIAVDHTSFARKMDFINTITRHYLYKYADGLSILTQRDAQLLGKKYPQKRVIYNPLTYPLLSENPIRRNTILCVGRFDIWEIKGFDLIIDMWAELFKTHSNWKLVFAGTGKPESVSYVKGLVNLNKIENSVEFLGQVDDMATLYSHSGIFALSSRIEGFPMVLLEAMSQGCPCVAFNVGGASKEMISDGAGFVVNDGDLDSFKEALSILMDNETKRNQYSQEAIKSASRFSVARFTDEWEKLISETLKNKC